MGIDIDYYILDDVDDDAIDIYYTSIDYDIDYTIDRLIQQ